jgi:hypothetical protein
MKDQGYVILEFEEAQGIKKILYIPKSKYQLQSNYAIVYPLRDGRQLLFPVGGRKAVLFENATLLLETIEEIGVPIEEENKSVFQKEQERFLDLENHIDYYIAILSNAVGKEIFIKTGRDSLEDVSKKLKPIFRKHSFEELYEKYYIPLGIYCGEVIKKIVPAQWELQKHYGINPYYIPYLVNAEGKHFNSWKPILDAMESKRYVDVVQWINRMYTPKIFASN